MPNPRFSEMPTEAPVEVNEFQDEAKGELVDLEAFRAETEAVKARVGREVQNSAAAREAREETQKDIERARIKRAEQRKAVPVEGVSHHAQWQEGFPNNIENPAGNMLSRRQLEKGDGLITRLQNYLFKRGEKK